MAEGAFVAVRWDVSGGWVGCGGGGEGRSYSISLKIPIPKIVTARA